MALTRKRMIEAYQTSDARFDGRFYLCVRTTRIYCKPSCGAKKPNPENVEFVDDLITARERGFRPCKRCRPDDDLLDEADVALRAIWEKPERFADAAALGRSLDRRPTALSEWCRRHAHRTPLRLLHAARVERATELLEESRLPVGEVGLEVGFESNSAFYERFGEFMGLAPGAYRELGPDFDVAVGPERSIAATLRTMGRDPASPTERVENGVLRLSVGRQVLDVEFDGTIARVRSAERPYEAHRAIRRVFGLGQDLAGFGATLTGTPLAALADRLGPVRTPQTFDAFEALCWSIVGQQIALPFADQLRRTLHELASDPIADGFFTRLEPARVAALPISSLTARKFSARKAAYLIELAKAVASGELALDSLARGSAAAAEELLLAQRGLGPWSVNYMLMRGLGFSDGLPLGDTGLRAGLGRALERDTKMTTEEIERAMRPYRPYRAMATYLIWQSMGGAA